MISVKIIGSKFASKTYFVSVLFWSLTLSISSNDIGSKFLIIFNTVVNLLYFSTSIVPTFPSSFLPISIDLNTGVIPDVFEASTV